MSTVNVGFVGAGGNAQWHMGEVEKIEGVRIAAVCDVAGDRAESAAGKYGANAYTDAHRLVEKEDLDALYVSVPPFAHGDVEILAAQKGMHLFVEKPVALSLEKGLEICEAIERAGVISCVGYQLRYCGTVERALDFLDGRTIVLVTSDRWGGLPGTPWWNVMAKSGGQLVEQTTHQVDMIRCLAGEILEVYSLAALRTLGDVPGLDVPDVQALTFRMENGAIGSLTTSCALNKGGGYSNLDIMVKDAVLHWGYDSLSATPEEDPPLGDDLPTTSSIDEVFIRAVRTQDDSEIRSPYRDALRTLDVTLAANESARTGKPVETLLSA